MLAQRVARRCARTARTSRELLERDQAGAQAVVDVVRVVGDLVGQVAQLRLQARLRAGRGSAGRRRRAPRLERSRIAREQCLRMPSRVSKLRFRPSKRADSAPPARRRRAGSAGCARSRRARACSRSARPARRGRTACGRGRARARWLRPGPRSAQSARDRARELRDLERVRQPRAEQVALVVEEDLGLVDEPAERGANARCGRGRAGIACASARGASAWRRPRDARRVRSA